MNESVKVKVNQNPEIADELTKAILSKPIADQNEIIGLLRRNLANERNAHIKELQCNAEDLSNQIASAVESLKTIIVGELK